MRKSLALVLALAMLLTALVIPAATAEEVDWSTKNKLKITWTTYFTSLPEPDSHFIKFVEDKFNVDIDMLPIDDSTFNEVLNTYIMAGETPDVIRLKDPGQFISYVDSGELGVIDMDVLRKFAPSITTAIDEFKGGSFWDYGVVDGKPYGIPAVAPGNIYHLPVVYNQTWIENLGAKVPETLDELHELLVRFTKEDPDKNGKDDSYGVSSDGLRALWGAYGVNPGACDGRTDHSYFQLIDGQAAYAATTEQYKEALKVAHQWYEEGIIDPEFITGENTGGYWAISHSVVNHRIGMTVRGNYYHWVMPGAYQLFDEEGNLVDCDAGAVAKEFLAVNPDEAVVLGQPPVGPYGSGVKSWNLLAQIYCFSKDATENPEKWERICAIMEYMDHQYVLDKDLYTDYWTSLYGEYGKYWIWEDEDAPVARTTTKFDEDYPQASTDKWGPTQWGPTLPILQGTKGNQWATSIGYEEGGIVNLMQFSLPAVAENQNNVTHLKDTWMIDFITGAKDVDADWDAYVKELNAAGLEKMVKEVQEWYASTQAQ